MAKLTLDQINDFVKKCDKGTVGPEDLDMIRELGRRYYALKDAYHEGKAETWEDIGRILDIEEK